MMYQINICQMESNVEIWKDIEGYEGLYQVSNLGRFKDLLTDSIIIHTPTERHIVVGLRKNNILKPNSAHRLVAKAFLPLVEGKNLVDHINGIKTDNRAVNLRWCTHWENLNFDNHKRVKPKSSKYRGVSLVRGLYSVNICANGKNVFLGCFKNEIEAANVYREAFKNFLLGIYPVRKKFPSKISKFPFVKY